jgi:hypothetical protein
MSNVISFGVFANSLSQAITSWSIIGISCTHTCKQTEVLITVAFQRLYIRVKQKDVFLALSLKHRT